MKRLEREANAFITSLGKNFQLKSREVDALKTSHSKLGEMYGLYKTTKLHVPLRPVESCCDTPAEKLSWFLDFIFHGLQEKCPSFLDSAEQLLSFLSVDGNDAIGLLTALASIDFKSLYVNTPTNEEGVKRFFSVVHDSEWEFPPLNTDELGLYLIDNFTSEELEAAGVSHLLPTRRGRGRSPENVPDSWRHYVRNTTVWSQTHIKKGLELVLTDVIRYIFDNNYFRKGEQIFRQDSGAAMGNRFSAVFCCVYLVWWESQIPEYWRQFYLWWKRYMDDSVLPWKDTKTKFLEFVDALNAIDEHMQVTYEFAEPNDSNGLPFLDLLLHNDSGTITWEFFRKPQSSSIKVHYLSAHPLQQKQQYISNEMLRRYKNCKDPAKVDPHVQEFSDRLVVVGGYPRNFVDACAQNASRRWLGIQRQVADGERPLYRSREWRATHLSKNKHGPPGPAVLWVPRRDDRFFRKVQNIIRRSGVDIQAKEISGMPLRNILTRSALRPSRCHGCGLCINQDTKNGTLCLKKDICYEAKCNFCDQCYIGETGRTLQARSKEHTSSCNSGNVETSALAQHMFEEHPNAEPSFEYKVLAQTKGFAHRKCTEAVRYKMDPSRYELNRRRDGNGIVELNADY